MDACLEAGVHYLDTANYEPQATKRSSNITGNGPITTGSRMPG